jgi:hypothetical protein
MSACKWTLDSISRPGKTSPTNWGAARQTNPGTQQHQESDQQMKHHHLPSKTRSAHNLHILFINGVGRSIASPGGAIALPRASNEVVSLMGAWLCDMVGRRMLRFKGEDAPMEVARPGGRPASDDADIC